MTVTNTFTVLNPNTLYTLRLHNGGLVDSSTDRVSSTTVTLNGVVIVATNDLNQNVAEVDRAVTLQTTNQLDVQVRGAPGGTLSIDIIGVDNDAPRHPRHRESTQKHQWLEQQQCDCDLRCCRCHLGHCQLHAASNCQF